MLNKIPGIQRYHMFTDRYYTNYILAEELAKLKCHLTGTILTNRNELPNKIKKKKKTKFLTKSTVAHQRGNTLFLAWEDKRIVICLTTKDNVGMTNVKRILRSDVEVNIKYLNIILNYIKYMSDVV